MLQPSQDEPRCKSHPEKEVWTLCGSYGTLRRTHVWTVAHLHTAAYRGHSYSSLVDLTMPGTKWAIHSCLDIVSCVQHVVVVWYS